MPASAPPNPTHAQASTDKLKIQAWVVDATGKRIHKSTYLARVSASFGFGKQSKDRLLRVQGECKMAEFSGSLLRVGSWGAFYFESRKKRQKVKEFFVGQILHFRDATTLKPLKVQQVSIEDRPGKQVLVAWYQQDEKDVPHFRAYQDDPAYYDLFSMFYVITDYDYETDLLQLHSAEYRDLLQSFENVTA